MASKKNLRGHKPDESGVCSKCGLEMDYLLMAKAKCSVADEEEAPAEAPAEEAPAEA